MTRIQEKVKDLVDVRNYESLSDFSLDPALTLSNYYFSDATSELMAKWLDKLANAHLQGGSANALAGYRGVGKSHFLATLGALAAHADLRTKISDAHVETSAQRLQRRRYPVAMVRRGTRETIQEEFADALAAAGTEVDMSTASVAEALTQVVANASDHTFVLLIDTAFERGSRVTRDDGPFLGEVAEAAKGLNIFVGVALDDDIAGADGSNSVIARTYSIDYLDQEHLYKVVNANIFPKARTYAAGAARDLRILS